MSYDTPQHTYNYMFSIAVPCKSNDYTNNCPSSNFISYKCMLASSFIVNM